MLTQRVLDPCNVLVYGSCCTVLAIPATGGLGAVVRFVSEILATFAVIEWIVLLLSRDHQIILSARAAMLTGVPAEEAPSVPWVRLDVQALIQTARHKWSGLVLIVLVAVPLACFLILPIVGDALYTVLLTAWCAYWLAVLAIARSRLRGALRRAPRGFCGDWRTS